MNLGLRRFLFAVLLVALLGIPRFIGLDRFATIDEPYWLTAGSDFYYALGQRAFANTVYDYHPAVTTMWVVTAGMLFYFPQYRGLGQGYFDVYKDSLERFLLAHGHTPLGLLTAARTVQTVVIIGLLLVLFLLLRRLLGAVVAWSGTLLIGFDPFFLGHSRLLNHEGMLSLFVLISLLLLLVYQYSRRWYVLVLLSGAAAGFAQLTKSSSVVLLPVVGLLLLLDIWQRADAPWPRRLMRAAVELGGWLAALAAVYVVFWPGMWVAPGEMLYQVFGNALSYAFGGSRLSVTGGVETAPLSFSFRELYGITWNVLWRTTPVGWAGLLLAVSTWARQGRAVRVTLLSLFVTGALFILMFALAAGRNSAHYMLTAYLALDIIAAAGYVYTAARLEGRIDTRWVRLALPALACLVVVLQAASALSFFPYYYTYFNPIMEAWQPGRQNPNYGYGEGLELAAQYLARKPDAARSTALVFYGRGSFSYFYPGKTEQLKAVYAEAENVPQLIQVLGGSQYIVIYYQLEHQRNSPANVMQALQGAQPEKVIWMNGIEYERIYRVQDLPHSFTDLLAQPATEP